MKLFFASFSKNSARFSFQEMAALSLASLCECDNLSTEMKILCETQVINRNTQAHRSVRAPKATVAVGFHAKAKTKENNSVQKELEIIHFTPQNATGTRYKVHDNIEKIFTKFIKDGKATIGFKQPPENLMIKCDPIQLKAFLQTLKLGLDGKEHPTLNLSIASATAIPRKSQPQRTLTVLRRGDYPTKGFPKTLKKLTISGIELCKVSFEICSLRNLTSLNLSSNKLAKIPTELGRLMLEELLLNDNALGEMNTWQWVRGANLQKSLHTLDISANKLTYFPMHLLKCTKLNTLKLNHNQISRIPFGVRRLRNLRSLHIASNELTSLPSAFNYTSLEVLDVWGNRFESYIDHQENPQHIVKSASSPMPLWLLALRTVSTHKVPYTSATLPYTLVDLLEESPKCACGKLCYNETVLQRATLATFENVKKLIFCRNRLIYVDIVLCGLQCIGLRQLLVVS